MKLQEVTAYNLRSQTILNESWETLTENQRIYVGKWEKELWPLLEEYVRVCEAELNPNQIKSIFTSAEQQAAGQKTGLGKAAGAAGAALKLPVELAKKVDTKVNELGKLAQNAGPVKNADAKFAQLKKDITANNSDSKIVQGVQKISDWAKANPGKASLAVGILTTMAAFAGGPAGGAAAGLILRASKDLLQGEKLSTAVGKSVKTAAYGALAGMTFKYISDNIIDNIASADAAEFTDMKAGLRDANYINAKADVLSDIGQPVDILDNAMRYRAQGNVNSFYFSYDTVVPGNMQAQFETLEGALEGVKTGTEEFYAAAAKFHDFMGGLQNSTEAKNLTAAWDAIQQIPKDALTAGQTAELLAQANSSEALISAIETAGTSAASVVQGALATVDDNAKKAQQAKPIDPEEKKELEAGAETKAESLTMEEKYELYLQEGPLADKLKGAASKAAGAVKGAAGKAAGAVKQAGKDITQQVTANKLMKAWKAAGEPTDTGSIVNILSSAGVSDDQIATIGQEQKVKLPAPTKAPQADKAAAPQADKAAAPQADKAAAPQADKAAAPQAGGEQPTSAPTAQKGDTKKIGGATYQWEGALWVDTATNKPVGIANAMEIGLGNPKLDPIIALAKKDPALAKLIKAQVTAKGVKAGTSAAKQAADAGVKGTEVVKTKANTKVSKAPAPKPAAPKAKAAPKPAAPKAKAAPKPELRLVK